MREAPPSWEPVLGPLLALYLFSASALEGSSALALWPSLAVDLLAAAGCLTLLTFRRVRVGSYAVCTALFVLTVLWGVLAASGRSPAAEATARWVVTAAVLSMVVFFHCQRAPGLLEWIWLGNLLGALVLAGRICWAYGGPEGVLSFLTGPGEHRLGELLANTNGLGQTFANGVLCGLALLHRTRNHLFRLLLSGVCGVLSGFLLLTGSRKAALFLGCSCAAYVLFALRDRCLGRGSSLLLPLAAMALVLAAGTRLSLFSTMELRITQLLEALRGTGLPSFSDGLRLEFFCTSMEAFWERPLLGWGTAWSHHLFGTYSHSNFTELLLNHGLAGFGLYYFPRVLLAVRLFRCPPEKDGYRDWLLVNTLLQLFLGLGWVNYYERIVQLHTAAAWGFVSAGERRKP